ncbi:MAG TPA: ATP-binding protein [Mucilaginibacter sp.]|jgi:signal transduction histidine kinase|nr:ATP-binding protein [Mucilaginibacter sp.]
MKKACLKILLLLLIPSLGIAQQSTIDSLKKALQTTHTDSARFPIVFILGLNYDETNRDTSLYYFDRALTIVKKNNQPLAEAACLSMKGYVLMHLGKYPESLGCLQQASKLAEDPENENKTWALHLPISKNTPHNTRIAILANIHHNYGHLMGNTNNIDEQIVQYKEAKKLAGEVNENQLLALVNMNLGHVYIDLRRLDSALVYEQDAERIMKRTGFKKYLSYVYLETSNIYIKKRNAATALQYFHKAANAGIEQKNFAAVGLCYRDLANYYLSEKQKDSSLYYAKKMLGILYAMRSKDLGDAYAYLYQSYKLAGKTDSAYKYQGLALTAKDSSFKATVKSLADFQKLSFQAQIHAEELEKEQAATQTKIRTYVLLAGIAVLLLLAGIFYRNNRQKQKVNNLLSQQKEEIASQRDNLENTLSDLKATQTQLIQSEKMASLGELTAGIAHEIQNPLNFVNNFSEVNKELLTELKHELAAKNYEEVSAIADDVIGNEEKINHHGKRADFIVKGMLEHSRQSTGQKELTDINTFADEYLRLAYHGMRGKDKNFNAEIITNFEEHRPATKIVQQEIGRALLNILNNAFYAVRQKAKTAKPDYKPTIEVTTWVFVDGIGIIIKDNGIGISDAIKDKIMQPFFTTKPTGEGTGLGLSLTYDMVVKGHGGSIEVNTKEGEFTEFIVKLPF